MRGHLKLLQNHIDVEGILSDVTAGTVVIGVGHIIDQPGRETPRFPNDRHLVEKIASEIKERLEELNAAVGYCSAASGVDLLFAQAMIDRGPELHVVLPFDANDFVTSSVDFEYNALAEWKERFDNVMAGAEEIHYATEDKFLGDKILFEFGINVVQGLAITQAKRLKTELVALVVYDTETSRKQGTGRFLDNWSSANGRLSKIELSEITSKFTDLKPTILGKPDR